ncbi:MAG TPA: GNAT family N-acetyltransferase [Anaerolineales bacterium]|nr:GNAT family N-acetyltransferase [Anaerolineales bacterium]
MKLHRAGWRDVLVIWRVQVAAFGPDAWDPIEVFWQLLFAPVRIKAVDGDQVVGFVFAERRSRQGLVTSLGVHPARRRRGIGRGLLQAAERALATQTIGLTVRASNQAAQGLYIAQGYRPVRRIPRYYSGGEDGVEMERRDLV